LLMGERLRVNIQQSIEALIAPIVLGHA
jgi:hypothetical protein